MFNNFLISNAIEVVEIITWLKSFIKIDKLFYSKREMERDKLSLKIWRGTPGHVTINYKRKRHLKYIYHTLII